MVKSTQIIDAIYAMSTKFMKNVYKGEPLVLASHMGTSLGPSCSFSNRVPSLWPEEKEGNCSLGPWAHMGDPQEAPDSWIQISSVLAVVAKWRTN